MVSTLAGGRIEYFRGRSGGSSATPGRGLRGAKVGGWDGGRESRKRNLALVEALLEILVIHVGNSRPPG